MASIYDDKILGLKQQQQFARALREQNAQQPSGQMVSGWYVPNYGGAIAGALGNVVGAYQEGQAQNKIDALERERGRSMVSAMNQAGYSVPESVGVVQVLILDLSRLCHSVCRNSLLISLRFNI
mgnify:CR=1 FL=1